MTLTNSLPTLLVDLLKSGILDTMPLVCLTAPDTKTKRHRREFVKAIKRQLGFLMTDYSIYKDFQDGGKRHQVAPTYPRGFIRWWNTETLELCIRKATSIFMADFIEMSGFGATYLGVKHDSHEELAQTLLRLIGYTELGYFDKYLTVWDFGP